MTLESKLDWDEVEVGDHGRLLDIYRSLIALRRKETDLTDPWLENLLVDYDEEHRWIALHRGSLSVMCNIGPDNVRVPVTGDVVLASGQPAVDVEAMVLQGHSFAILRSVR